MTCRHLVPLLTLILGLAPSACGGSDGASGGDPGGGGGSAGGEAVGGAGGAGGEVPEPRCGDGRVDEGEACDDGNLVEDDGCDTACVSSCGDLALLAGVETCEDGNRAPGDGCSPACRLERDTCTAGPVPDLGAYRVGLTRFLAVGTTLGAEDLATPGCSTADGGERVFGLFVAERSYVELGTDAPQTEVDTVLSVRRGDCTRPAAELACNDDRDDPVHRDGASRVVLEEVAAATQLYVFVDAKEEGPFALEAWVRPLVAEGEACGRLGGPRCVTGLDCIAGVCGAIVCGDGTVSPGEECDPGVPDPGCLPDCRKPVCGDGVVQGLEPCDDGNGDETDGCTTTCQVPVCGDGLRTPDEECDDGSAADDGDGCGGCRLGCPVEVPARRSLPTATSCLAVPEPALSFRDAAAHCGAFGGHLVVIEDAAENEVVRRVAGANAWIGLSDAKSEGTFAWQVGDSSYTNWAEGEPNDWGEREDCAEIYPGGLWNDNHCGVRRLAVCEFPRP